MLDSLKASKNFTVLNKNEQKSIEGGGVGSCIRRHQRLITRVQNDTGIREDQRSFVISQLVADAERCYDRTNLF